MKKSGMSLAALGFAVVAVAGCASAGHEKADTTALSMDAVRAAVINLKETSASAATAAGAVVEKADVDPKTAFAAYKAELEKFADAVEHADSLQKKLKSQDTDFFAGWEKQIESLTDADMKQRAVERRAKLQKSIEAIDNSVKEMNAEVGPFLTSMKNLEVYWSNDLTPGGITSIKDKVSQANGNAKKVGDKCDGVTEALDKAAPEFRTAKPPPPPEMSPEKPKS